jgi:pSer/pThr/pTyr-binding forkhead associated (FHA) protein
MKMLLQTRWPLEDSREVVVDRFPFVIGRRKDNDFNLPLVFVSRHHCQLMRSNGQILVQDLESYNGTYVNGKRAISPLPLKHGDELSLGPCSFRVVILDRSIDTPPFIPAVTAKAEVLSPSGAGDGPTVSASGLSVGPPFAGNPNR